jgi:predicted nucleotidyltransferase
MTKEYILDYLRNHREEFKERYAIEKIGLFGSYARGEALDDSDVDIFVQMKPDLLDMVGLKLQIEEDLDKKVDIIREHKQIKPLFLKMIQKDIVYV